MTMSKRREYVPAPEGDLQAPPEGDLAPYVIFTQLKEDGPFIYAGWLDAVDNEMALAFAREHYGQDQVCTRIWAIPRPAVHGDGGEVGSVGGAGAYAVFHQSAPGELYISRETTEAMSPEEAFAQARATSPDVHGIWVVPMAHVAETKPDEVIWRLTDQTYRLARGYAKDVRDKWRAIRARGDDEAYEAEDIKETF